MIKSIITFLPSIDNEQMHHFYGKVLAMSLYKDQGICKVYQSDCGYIGFCSHYNNSEPVGVVCFVVDSIKEVDRIYELCKANDIKVEYEPVNKDEFGIYQFYAYDPSDNRIEFQCFI